MEIEDAKTLQEVFNLQDDSSWLPVLPLTGPWILSKTSGCPEPIPPLSLESIPERLFELFKCCFLLNRINRFFASHKIVSSYERAELKGVYRQLCISSIYLCRAGLLLGLISSFECLHWQIVQCNRSGSVERKSTMQVVIQYMKVHRNVFQKNACNPNQNTAVAVPLMTFWILASSSESSLASTRFLSSNSVCFLILSSDFLAQVGAVCQFFAVIFPLVSTVVTGTFLPACPQLLWRDALKGSHFSSGGVTLTSWCLVFEKEYNTHKLKAYIKLTIFHNSLKLDHHKYPYNYCTLHSITFNIYSIIFW